MELFTIACDLGALAIFAAAMLVQTGRGRPGPF
jgi:hypothetical protein